MEVSQYFGILAVTALSGVLTAGLVMVLGGLGALREFHRRLRGLENALEDTDNRITKEVKRRASDAALEARKANPKTQAEEYMAAQPASARKRPTVVGQLKA